MNVQEAEQFVRDYFRERTEVYKKELEIITPFRGRYFDKNCNHDSREGSVERRESETVLKMTEVESGFDVVTRVLWGQEIGIWKRLYRLRQTNGIILIHETAEECLDCKGEPGKAECLHCGGTGWMDPKGMKARLKAMRAKTGPRSATSPETDEPILNRLFRRLKKKRS